MDCATPPKRSPATEALRVAIMSGIGAQVAAQLIAEGADPLESSNDGLDAFGLALGCRDLDCLRALLDSGAADHDEAALTRLRRFAEHFGIEGVAPLLEARLIARACPDPGPPRGPLGPRL